MKAFRKGLPDGPAVDEEHDCVGQGSESSLWLLGAPLSISSAWPLPLLPRVVSTAAGPHSFLLSRGQQWFPGKWRGPWVKGRY